MDARLQRKRWNGCQASEEEMEWKWNRCQASQAEMEWMPKLSGRDGFPFLQIFAEISKACVKSKNCYALVC